MVDIKKGLKDVTGKAAKKTAETAEKVKEKVKQALSLKPLTYLSFPSSS